MKRCPKCGEIKALEMFYRNKNTKCGRNTYCKKCDNEICREWRKNNVEKSRECARRWQKANPEKKREHGRRWIKNNPDKVAKMNGAWQRANPEKAREIVKNWRKNNIERGREISRLASQKIRNTPRGRLSGNIANSIGTSLRGNKRGQSWEVLVGYTVDQLKKHLEKQFLPGMSWENYGVHGWHIDHKTPISVFNFEKPEDDDFKRCWALDNLRPLWAFNNRSKNNRLDKHFQPKLIF